MRRLRRRERNGLAVLPVEVDLDALAGALIDSCRISERDSADRARLATAVAVLVADFVARWRG
jgi:hypothetical protein